MRAMFVWMLVLHTLHVPVPFPDLDGECRGTPIQSFADAHAWHVLLLGVLPNDDIDRGPFRTDDEGHRRGATDSPFGDSGILSAASVSVEGPPTRLAAFLPFGEDCLPVRQGDSDGQLSSWITEVDAPVARAACVRFCVWQV